MRRQVFFLLSLIFFLFLLLDICHLYALPKALELSAKKLELLQEGKKLLAQGDVIVEQKEFLLYAEEILYEPKGELMEIRNFKFFDFVNNATFLGDRAQLDMRHNELYSDRIFIYFKKEGYKIKAWGFSKNALNEYKAKRAIITTCQMDCESEDFPAWSFEVRDLVLTPEGYSSALSTLFRAKSLPLAYIPKTFFLPKVSLPIFEPRKRGFLFPGLTQGNRFGLGFQISYFIPLTDQIDFTLSPLITTKRGILYDLENQFALKEDIKALFKMRYLRDTKKSTYALTSAPKDRYWISGKSDIVFSPNLDLHLDLDFVSDRDFLEEFNIGEGSFDRAKLLYLERFGRDIEDKSQDFRTSKIWLQYKKDSLYSRWLSSYRDYEGNLDKKEILQPWVSLHLALLPTSFRQMVSSLDLDYNYFDRKKGYRGTRTGLNVEITYPFAFSLLKSELKFNFKNYFFALEEKGNFKKDNINSFFIESSWNTYTQLGRFYTLNESLKPIKFQHLLRPYFEIFLRSKPSEERIPIFLQEDLLIKEAKTLEYGLWQFFSTAQLKNFLVLKAYQQYDLNRPQRGVTTTKPEVRPFSDLYLQILAQWKDRFSLRYDTSYNFYGYGFKKHTLNLSLGEIILEKINFLYQEDEAYQTRQVTLNLSQSLLERLLINYYFSRNLKKNETSEQKIEALYYQDCYLFGLGLSITPRDTKIYFRVDLKGLGGLQKQVF